MSRAKKFDFNQIKNHVREFRNNLTDSEKLLWKELKGRKLSGYKFLRQHPILYKGNLIRYNYFIADFYCYEKKAVIELDGPIHEKTAEYDAFRDEEMKNLDLHILRIKNNELENIEEVLLEIEDFLRNIS
jgi:very-short-patch-repair endonuclease